VNAIGDVIELREVRFEDADAVLAWTSDPEVLRHVAWETGDRQRAETFVRAAIASAREQPRSVFELAIVELSTGQVVGACRLCVKAWLHRRADIGYILRRDRWGRGYASEAASLLLGLGWDLGMHRIEATCHPDNAASARVLEKAGMRLEGRLRDYTYVRGEWWDALLYAVLADDARRFPKTVTNM
jgi:RimJ/RimL family protein N-acetyltransferase